MISHTRLEGRVTEERFSFFIKFTELWLVLFYYYDYYYYCYHFIYNSLFQDTLTCL